ncbi:DUF5385 domain-containing protein [Ureaplasma miroungigenitalium]|uniref:DUF5385 domain-containing protein n=1 Tax=Ureaplasma miroungigenitalium TaxID=1042321 RepID=A0ABT3BM18_9BACT|nr:DUF5385 domain-containing protein [Ureaplasma miroungigenitalium]MCV3728290.1 DUF5385 domain-containing protein [Ureaplasma miroungigenitalium]MCV3734095.1 DUF5385 domain-containing protein [Ureaplasma miroungigenitalium]
MINNVIHSILHAEQPGGNKMMFMLIILIPIVIVIFFVIKKRKKQNAQPTYVGNKSSKDANEVWLTVKKYLRDINDKGKEVIDSYVVRRPDPHNVGQMTKLQREDYKQEMDDLKALKSTNPTLYREEMKRIKKEKTARPKELYVVLFTTRNAKTFEVDEPRAFECEVKNIKINKKETKREIEIVRPLDYDVEYRWIKEMKDRDDKMQQKQLEADRKRQMKAQARLEKQKNKEQKNKSK